MPLRGHRGLLEPASRNAPETDAIDRPLGDFCFSPDYRYLLTAAGKTDRLDGARVFDRALAKGACTRHLQSRDRAGVPMNISRGVSSLPRADLIQSSPTGWLLRVPPTLRAASSRRSDGLLIGLKSPIACTLADGAIVSPRVRGSPRRPLRPVASGTATARGPLTHSLESRRHWAEQPGEYKRLAAG